MGFLKGFKDMKQAVAAAPAMINQAQQLGANAQMLNAAQMDQLMVAQQAAMTQQAAMSAPIPAADLEPIAGVDLPTYAAICKAIVPLGYDQSALPGIAAGRGISREDWDRAAEGWVARMSAVPALGPEFRRHYDAA